MLNVHQSINNLNLEPIMVSAMDEDEGYSWSLEFTKQVAAEYKKYLTLCLENPNSPVVPSSFVDKFWHLHILDTQKYAADCNEIFGSFLHHFPYFGMRGVEDEKNLKQAWSDSRTLYIKRFGKIDNALWPTSARCPNCGRRSENECFQEVRPQLKLAA